MTSVLDLRSCNLVGYSFGASMKTSLVLDAVTMALENKRSFAGVIFFHSDQRSQYFSNAFLEVL